jgi:ParB-like chromosome segregation protein Spo0J
MTAPTPAPPPAPALFDVSGIAKKGVEGRLERFALDQIELAPNARREISSEGIDRLAGLLMRAGQLVPCIGYRADPAGTVTVYEGQRRYLAAQRSHELAGTEGFEGLKPVHSLIVLLLDHERSTDEIRRIQAIANNAREELSLIDQQAQFADCWLARAGLSEEDRIAAVCADLGIAAKKAHNLRRQLTLPEPIRARVAKRPVGEQVSATMANQLADLEELDLGDDDQDPAA